MDPTTKNLIRETVQETIAQYQKAHPCRFTDDEAGNIHAMTEALREEGGNHQTIRVWVQFGKTYQDVTASARKWSLIILVLVVTAVAAAFGLIKLNAFIGGK